MRAWYANLQPRERWVLAGGNGAGKTQLLKVIAGSVWPTPDSVRRYVYQDESWLTPAGVAGEILDLQKFFGSLCANVAFAE